MAQLISKHYELYEELGSGGMGTVYRGVDNRTEQPVAIKLLKPEALTNDPGILERFAREGEALRQLNHPNIVKMLDAIEADGKHYLIIEYMPGGDLRSLLKQQAAMPIDRVLQIALDLADALTRAHRLNIIHRDLKPANVLIADDGTPRLTDFGVAHMGKMERVTDTGVAVGTIDYLAPEALGGDAVDARADIWSFGVMLFEMIAGQKPFDGQMPAQVLTAILTQPVPDLETLRSDCPLALMDLIYRMLEKDREARIRSVRLIGAELEAIMQGVTPSTSGAQRNLQPDINRFATPTPTIRDQVKHNLPVQTTPFVGREAELAELQKLVNDPNIRLITILAPGGMGKTRLALETATQFVGEGLKSSVESPYAMGGLRGDGVYFVELAPLSDPANIVSAIAEATGYQIQSDGREPKEQILDYLREKQILLIMDNFEHLMAGAPIVTDILQTAPQVNIIATSRQRLQQSGETVSNLEGMDFPDWETPEDALEYSAVKLFMQGARRAQPGFELQADDLDYVARICKMAQGIPLAILLAASWLEMLSAQEIADEMGKNLDFLETEMTDVPERQRSMRAVFEYSWHLLNEAEQQVLMKLSVFRGGFTREAAQAVTDATLRNLMTLVNKSLLRRDAESGRYEIHELLRQYAEEHLKQSDDLQSTQDAHSHYYANFLAELESDLAYQKQPDVLKLVEQEMENIRSGINWAVAHPQSGYIDLQLYALWQYYFILGRISEGIDIFDHIEQALEVEETHLLFWRVRVIRAYLLVYNHGYDEGESLVRSCIAHLTQYQADRDLIIAYQALNFLHMMQGHFEEAIQYAEKTFDVGTRIAEFFGEMAGRGSLAYAHFLAGDVSKAKDIQTEVVEKAEQANMTAGILALTYNNLGEFHHALGEDEQAKPLFERAYAAYEEMGNKRGMAYAMNNLGNVAHAASRFQEAVNYNQQSLDIFREIGDRRGIADALLRLANVQRNIDQIEESINKLQEAYALFEAIGDRASMGDALVLLGMATGGLGNQEKSNEYLERSLSVRQEVGNPVAIVDSMQMMAMTKMALGRLEEAKDLLDNALKVAKEEGVSDPATVGRDLAFRSSIALLKHDFERVLTLGETVIEKTQAKSNPWAYAYFCGGMGLAHYRLEQFGEAQNYAHESVQIAFDIGTLDAALMATATFAGLLSTLHNEHERAMAMLSLCLNGYAVRPVDLRVVQLVVEVVKPRLSFEQYEQALERGKSLDLDTVIQELLDEFKAAES